MAPNLLYQLLLGRSRVDLLHHPWVVVRHSPCHPPDAPQARYVSSSTVQRAQPFSGFLRKPLCEACEQGADERPTVPGSPTPLLTFTRGSRRRVDTRSHFCPAPDCSYRGWLGLGNNRANGHPGGQPWRQCQCVSCHGYFSETHGTLLHGQRSSPELIVRVIVCLAEGLGLRVTARVCEIVPNTVLQWLVEAAEQLNAFSTSFLHDLHLNQVQLDALYAVLSAMRGGEISNFVLPHTSLREALAELIPTNRRGAAKVWRPCTPAMAAGLTDHVWSLKEVLLFRVPPWPQPQTV